MTILAGDFNINRNELSETYVAKIFGMNADFVNHLDMINGEYECLINTLSEDL